VHGPGTEHARHAGRGEAANDRFVFHLKSPVSGGAQSGARDGVIVQRFA
jgi:hypothetical protein